ncbi:uncharacterized protein LOC110708803 [Chenopodium quinoa]|uniref:uncharacterized protein LOC110708803 n=1 Tax=Chenopodium quinoa TaxID=63459 RepID=UPI000B77E4F0|nr:uncharacterized protein LOC110708803 [Chenopodium quinoa]
MTCNANWPEIKDELATGERAQNRPDFLARVFRAKLITLIKREITERMVFGEVAAMTVCVHPHERLQATVSNSKRSKTQLTKFFAKNVASEAGLGYLYGEFCEHYTWDNNGKKWSQRVQNKLSIGRLAFVYPVEGERFFLRLLLLNVRSHRAFEDLRTVNGHLYPTFQEAVVKLGLIEDDDAADLTLAESCETHMPAALRWLFATVLIFFQPNDPTAL